MLKDIASSDRKIGKMYSEDPFRSKDGSNETSKALRHHIEFRVHSSWPRARVWPTGFCQIHHGESSVPYAFPKIAKRRVLKRSLKKP